MAPPASASSVGAASLAAVGLCTALTAAVVCGGGGPLHPEPEPEPEPKPEPEAAAAAGDSSAAGGTSRRATGAGSVAAALADGLAIVDGTTKKSTKEPQQHAVADFLASMPPGFLDDLFPKIKAVFAPHTVKYNNTNAYIKADDASKSGTGGTQEKVEWKVRATPAQPERPRVRVSRLAGPTSRGSDNRMLCVITGELVHGA